MDKKSSILVRTLENFMVRIKPKYYPLIAFALTTFVYSFAFSILGMIGNSVFIIETGDLNSQFIPFIMQMCDVIRGKHSLWYSWNIVLGTGSIGNYAYFTFSPFNLFYLFLGPEHVHTASALVIILKASVSAMTFQLFLSRILKKIYYETVLFSMLYALNGFVICYYHVTIFMDAVMIFPLIMLGIVLLVNENKIFLLVFSYTYLFFSQFYMGYIAGVMSFLLFITYYGIFIKEKNIHFKVLIKYFYSVVLSLGLTAFVWMPALLNIMEMDTSDPMYESVITPNIILILNNMFMGQYQSMDGFIPFYYCGILTALALPMFFLNEKNDKKRRIFYFINIIMIFIIMSFLPLNLAMHGFDQPNMIGYRYAFVMSFMLVTILAEQFPYIKFKKINIKYIITFMLIFTAVFLFSKFDINNKWGADYDCNSLVVYIVNFVFIFLWCVLIGLYKIKKTDRFSLRVFFTALIITETVTNICLIQTKIEKPGVLVDEYMTAVRNNTVKKIRDNSIGDLYIRTIYEDSSIIDVGLKYDISSLSFFSPIINNRLVKCLPHLGFRYLSNYFVGAGWTPVTASLLGIDFVVDGAKVLSDNKNEQVMLEVNDRYYQNFAQNSKVLPVAFSVNSNILNYIPEQSVFDNQDNILSLMCGENVNCYIPTKMTIEDKSIRIEERDDNIRIYNNNYPNDTFAVKYISVERRLLPIYAELFNEIIPRKNSVYFHPPVINARYENDLYNTHVLTLYPSNLFEVPVDENGNGLFYIVIPKDVEYAEYKKGYFEYYDKDEFARVFEKLSQNSMTITEFKDGYVKGNINCDEERILFTSIPYEKGWKAYVNGNIEEIIPIVEDTFIGLKLAQGNNEIVLEYDAPGRHTGRYISIFSLALSVFFGIVYTLRNKGKGLIE